jgi:hypothetical protein
MQPALGYGSPYGYQAPTTSSGAITSLVLGIVSLVLCGLFTGIPAMIVGSKARKDIAASGGRQTGDGLAIGGVILGAIGTALSVIGIVIIFSVALLGSSTETRFEPVEQFEGINSDPSDGFCNRDRFLQDPDC